MRVPIRRPVGLARFPALSWFPWMDLFLLLVFIAVALGYFDQVWVTGVVDGLGDFRLPHVEASKPDDNPEPDRVVIHITKHGSTYLSGSPRSDRHVRDALAQEAGLSRGADGYATIELVIRADERVEFRHVQKIIDVCRDKKVRIWRLAFGVLPFDGRWLPE